MATKDDIIRLIWAVYDPQTQNEQRTPLTHELLRTVSLLNGPAVLELGMTLLQLTNDGSLPGNPAVLQSVRAYGAVLLRQGIVVGTLQVADVNPEALLSWMSYDTAMGPALRYATGNLIVVCAVRLFPDKWPTFVDTLLGDLHNKPNLLPMIKDFCDACVEPPSTTGANAGDVPVQRLKTIRAGIKQIAQGTTRRIIECMHRWFQEGHMQHVNVCLGLLTSLSATMTAQEWWGIGLHDVVRTLARSELCRKDAVSLAGALIRTGNQMLPTDPIACGFVADLIQVVEPAIQAQDWELVQELLDVVSDIPGPMSEQLQSTLVVFVELVLDVPSVLFGIAAADILKRLITTATEQKPLQTSITAPTRLLTAMSFFAQKHAVHPSFSGSACTRQATAASSRCKRAIEFSEEQFNTLASFDTAYADLRGTFSFIMQFLALHFPQECGVFCTQLLSQLPTVKYPYDPSTPIGNYTRQASQTFSEWSAAQFMLEHLGPNAFTAHSAGAGLAAFRSLIHIAPRDAVLIPTCLNMQLAFWESTKSWTDVSSCHELWRTSCESIFQYMSFLPATSGTTTTTSSSHQDVRRHPQQRAQVNFDDVDLVAARKRAYTCFVHVAVNYGARVITVPGLNLLELCSQQLVHPTTLSTEKAFLYEAVASLSNFMAPEEQTTFLNSMISTMRDVVVNINPASFLASLCDSSKQDRAKFRDSVSVLASILRRCNPSSYTQSLAISIIPAMGNLVLTIHNARADQVPPAYRSLFEMSHVDRDQFLTGGGARKSSVASGLDNNDVGRARAALQQIRLYLYQALGSIGKFVALESFTPSLMQTVERCAHFEIHTMRAFAENTLFRWVQSSAALGSFIFPALTSFFVAQREANVSRSAQDEIVDHKQLYFFSKDTMTSLSSVVEMSNWWLLPGLRDGVMGLLEALVQGAFDFRGACGTVIRLIEANLLGSTADAARCFCCIASTCASKAPGIAPKDVESVSGQLCFLYTSQMALFGGALRERGIPEELLNELNSHLALASRIDAKRRAFGDFLKKAAGGGR